MLRTAGSYGLPVYVTENGLADSDDDMRREYLLDHLRVMRGAMRDGLARVKGYFAWSLMDNFEWSAGYYPKFGFFSFDPEHAGTPRAAQRAALPQNYAVEQPAGRALAGEATRERRRPVYIGIGTLILILIILVILL